MQYYPPMSRKRFDTMKQFRGIATTEKFTTNEDYASVAINLDADLFPAMKTRAKRMRLATNMPTTPNGIQGLFRYKATYSGASSEQKSDEIIAINGARIFKYDSENNSWITLYEFPGVSINSNLPIAKDDWTATLFNVSGLPNMMFSNGASPLLFRYNGTSVTSFDPNIDEGFQFPKYITAHENRLFAAVGNTIRASAFGIYNEWNTPEETSVIVTELTDGETINGLHKGQERLLVFKPNHMYELFGVDIFDFRLVKVSEGIGVINDKCIADLNGVTYFLHTTGVYEYTGGRPRRISDIVKGYFDKLTKSRHNDCFVGTDGTRLFVNLGVQSNGNDSMLVWHSVYNVWYEWNGIYARCMLSGQDISLFGGKNSQVYGMNLPFGLNDEQSVSFTWISQPMNTGILAQRLRMSRAWITNDLTGTFHVYISKKPTGDSPSDWTEIKMVNGAGLQNAKTVIRTLIESNAKSIRLKIQGAGECTIHEIVRELKGFPIV